MNILRKAFIGKLKDCPRIFPKSRFPKQISVRRNHSRGTGLIQDNVLRSPYADITYPQLSVAEYLWEHSHQWNDKIALECAQTGKRVTYNKLKESSRSLASSFLKMGFKPGNDVVAIIMPNCIDAVVTLMACLQVGLTAALINPVYTQGEVLNLLDQVPETVCVVCSPSKVKEVLSLKEAHDKKYFVVCPATGETSQLNSVACLEKLIQEGNASEDLRQANPNESAIILFSSGTTGLPKAVPLTHRNIVCNIEQMTSPQVNISRRASGSFHPVTPVVLPIFHVSGSIVVCLHMLRQGSKLIMVPQFTKNFYLDILKTSKPTFLTHVPYINAMIASEPSLTEGHMKTVETIVTGAAPDNEESLQRLKTKFVCTPTQVYGMTETGGVVVATPRGENSGQEIGCLLPGNFAKVVDTKTGEALPANQNGEICLKGPSIMNGYWGNSAATGETFDSDGWLRTGDYGCYSNTGKISVFDRLKDVIKYKGYQVLPAELEGVLRQCPGVVDAGVCGLPDKKFGEIAVAVLVVDKSNQPTDSSLSDFMRKHLAEYKMVSKFLFADSIPRNTSGKILKNELRNMFL